MIDQDRALVSLGADRASWAYAAPPLQIDRQRDLDAGATPKYDASEWARLTAVDQARDTSSDKNSAVLRHPN
jgi:hypothetical protein